MNAPFPAMNSKSSIDKPFGVTITRDVKYGAAGIGFGGSDPRYRDLLLDIYEPTGDSRANRPALIMAFGGAWHRGSRTNDVVEEGDHRNTPVAEYCEEFAKRGFVCFAIDYRLMQEQPDPGVTPILPPGAAINVDRVNHVRGLLGLPPCTNDMMVQEIEASTDDMTAAISFVRGRARALRIDVDQLAIGGFSAGAILALGSAVAEQSPVAAVVALSGRLSMAVAQSMPGGRGPAVLTIIGENDLPSILDKLDEYTAHLKSASSENQVLRVPGGTHFYPRSALVAADLGAALDIETCIATFLHRQLRLDDVGK